MTPCYAIALSGAAFLSAAKAHGRQIRLERELAGFWRVVFGGRNPPFVMALWRRDRILFWCGAAAGLALFCVWAAWAARSQWRFPFTNGIGGVSWWAAIAVAVLWPLSAGFFVAGFASLARTLATYRKGESQVREWFIHVFWGSIGWWSLAAALLAAAMVLACLHGP